MVVLNKAIWWVIPIIALIIIAIGLYGPGGLLTKAREAGDDIIKDTDINIGANEISSGTPTIPEEHSLAVNSMINAIRDEMLKEDRKDCFETYGYGDGNGFPLLGEDGTSIIIRASPGETRIRVLGGESGQQLVEYHRIFGMQPCVIAGGRLCPIISSNNIFNSFMFYNKFFVDSAFSNECPYYQEVNEIRIYQDDDKNIIVYDGIEAEFEDGGWLVTPGNGLICFFPTLDDDDYCEADDYGDKEGLNERCTKQEMPTLLDLGQITRCRANE